MHRLTNMLRPCVRANSFRAAWKTKCGKTMCYYSPVYQWQDECVEELEEYSPGGYHPVRIGDEYCQSRYRVLHKLGHGSFSTVWLARDSLAGRYVSLKMNTADASKNNSEWCMLNKLQHQNPARPGSRFFPFPFNSFWIPGPNGNHLCFVSNVLGPTLNDIRGSYHELLPPKIARNVTVQLALALTYMHSRGIVHGDIQLNNIAFRLPNLDSWSIDQLYDRLGLPDKNRIHREDGQPLGPEAPPYTVCQAPLIEFGNPPMTHISILDFGGASPATDARRHCSTPLINQAPEALLGIAAGQPADIWAFACTVFALFGNRRIFDIGMGNETDMLAEIVDELGRLPQHLWEKWEWRWEHYEEDGTKKRGPAMSEYGVHGALVDQIKWMRTSMAEQLSEEDKAGLLHLLEACFRYETWERITAEEILELDWIKKLRAEYEMDELPALNDTFGTENSISQQQGFSES